MQSEVPTSKRHWNPPVSLNNVAIPPLNREDNVDPSTMKTTEDLRVETPDSGAETEVRIGERDETDRVSPSVTSLPLQEGGGKGIGSGELESVPNSEDHLSANGSSILAGNDDPKVDEAEENEQPHHHDGPKHLSEVDDREIEREKLSTFNEPLSYVGNEEVSQDLSPRSPPSTPKQEIDADTHSNTPDEEQHGGECSSVSPDGVGKCMAPTSNAASNVLEQTSPDSPDVHGDVPNGVAKMDGLQGYDNAAFSTDDQLKQQKQSIEAEPEESKVKPNSSPHVPRRVSFSERPPQRAVYDNGSATPGAPIDPAARAVKEQGFGPGEKWRVLRNVTLISAAFMVLFTAFFGAANLQSSVNPTGGLGTVSLTGVYAALIVSNLFLPSIVIKRLGCKWTVVMGMVLFTPYAVAQMAASWATLVPTALLAGAAGAPMWCAKCSYLNAAAGAYSAVTGSPRDLVMVRFFGLFYVLFPLGHVWGNLITSEVLSTNGVDDGSANDTLSALDVAALCGANFCPAVRSVEENPNLARPPDHLITTIAALFIALSLLSALLVSFGVDNLRRYGERLGENMEMGPEGSANGGGAALLVATLRLLGDRNQLMLVPITAFIGISQAFLGADFTESYIACAWGIPYIGYVLMGYGLASSLASVFVSWAVKRVGRLPVVVTSISLFLVLVGVLRWWTPQPGQGAAYVLLAAAWGLADSTALVINAMYGLLFRGREAAAYSNFSLWGSAGFIVTYSYSPHLCAVTKLAILAVVLFLSLMGFVVAERALRRILAAEAEAKTREEALAGSGISVISDKAHAA